MHLLAVLLAALAVLPASAVPAGATPEGQLTWGVHTTLVPSYFDPAETIIVTPFMVLYGLHDALVKPMPGTYWPPPAPAYDPVAARRLLAEAGYPGGFDAGEYFCDMTSADAGEAMIGLLQAVGIRTKLRPLERAAFNKAVAEKKLKNLVQLIGGGFGNAATRLEAYAVGGGTYAYGSYPDIDGLFREQATELDRAKREAILHRIQQMVHERAMFAPIYELAFISGVGRRVEESGLGLIAGYAFSAPYEDVRLKAR